MKSATYLIFFALFFIVGNEVYGQSVCLFVCPPCPTLTCSSGSYPLFSGGANSCQCCATCVTPKVGDGCYRENAVRTGPLSCGSELKCCTGTNTCQAK